MKRIITLLLAAVMVFSFSACGKSKDIQAAEDAISAIGEVTLESEGLIIQAEKLFGILTDAEKAEVSNRLTLVEAREQFNQMKKDAEAISNVEELIDSIGTIKYESENAILAAYSAFDALTPQQQAQVKNLDVLSAALQEWTDKYTITGNTFYSISWKLCDYDINDITKLNSLYVTVAGGIGDDYFQISDDYTRVLYKNYYGVWLGSINERSRGTAAINFDIIWDEPIIALEGHEVTYSGFSFGLDDGKVYLHMQLDGNRESKLPLSDSGNCKYHIFAVFQLVTP